ncbi:MAG TPA: glycosyltransferase family 4 protein [Chthonomonadales bacterium]|nr:glycosyltransferase family 4 protein [Chthonomonadales bacterium]
MRVMLQHYPGHSFSVELARQLARCGHEVTYVHCPSFIAPHGDLCRSASDPARFRIVALGLSSTFTKGSVVRRISQELSYGMLLSSVATSLRPDVVLSSNLLFSELVLVSHCRRRRVPYVPWVQDIYGAGVRRVLRRKLGPVATPLGYACEAIEARNLRAGVRVVSIAGDFCPLLLRFGVSPDRVTVIPNWAAIERIPMAPQRNAWSVRHGLAGRPVALYSGTLGLKHDPSLLLAVAEHVAELADAVLVVASEGSGADWLRRHLPTRLAARMLLVPYQDAAEFPAMLASAQVMLAILESDAGAYSIPSKVLAYLCAGRPIVASMPPENLSARLVESVGAGWVCPPGNGAALGAAVLKALGDKEAGQRMGQAGRAYAEAHFPIASVAARFERLLSEAARAGSA